RLRGGRRERASALRRVRAGQATLRGRAVVRRGEGSHPRGVGTAARRETLPRPAAPHDLRRRPILAGWPPPGAPALAPLSRPATRGASGPRWWPKRWRSGRSRRRSPCSATGAPLGVVACGGIAEVALRQWWGVMARGLALCALTPHAGEAGVFGDEDGRVLAPAARALGGAGPLPADTVFVRALKGEFDAV